MNTLIITIVIGVISFLAFKYFTGKNKSHDEKSGLEKISSTIVKKASMGLEEVADGIRDTETVKKELLKSIENNIKKLRTQYTEHFENLIRSRETYIKMNNSSSLRVISITERIRELKGEHAKSNNPEKKAQADGLIRVLIEAKRIQEKSGKNLSEVKEKIEKSKNDYEIAIMRMEEKRAEVTAIMCNSVISPTYLRDLERELKEKVDDNRFKNESANIIDDVDDGTHEISDDEVQKMYESI